MPRLFKHSNYDNETAEASLEMSDAFKALPTLEKLDLLGDIIDFAQPLYDAELKKLLREQKTLAGGNDG